MDPPFACKHCDDRFDDCVKAIGHYRACHYSAGQLLLCPAKLCGVGLRRLRHFERHILEDHANQSSFTRSVQTSGAFQTANLKCPSCVEGHPTPGAVCTCVCSCFKNNKGTSYVVTCSYVGCPYICVTANQFRIHAHRHELSGDLISALTPRMPDGDLSSIAVESGPFSEDLADELSLVLADGDLVDPLNVEFSEDDVKKKLGNVLLWLKVYGRVPESKVVDLMGNLITLERMSLSQCRKAGAEFLINCRRSGRIPPGFRADVTDSELENIAELLSGHISQRVGCFQKFCKPGKEFSSMYRLWNYARKFLPYVEPYDPLEAVFPPSDEYKRVPGGAHFNLTQELENFINNSSVSAALLESFGSDGSTDDGTIRSYRDGTHYKSLVESWGNERPVIDLALYVDDFDPSASLQTSHRTRGKICGIYYSVLNLPRRLRARLKCIRVVSLLISSTLSDFFVLAFRHVLKDLNEVATTGVYFKALGRNIKARLVFVIADNLEAHRLLNFNRSFSQKFVCRMCYATVEEFKEPELASETPKLAWEYEQRTYSEYDADLLRVAQSTEKKNFVDGRGFGGRSVFSRLNYAVHPLDICPSDLAHDQLEGTCKTALSLIFYMLTRSQSHVTRAKKGAVAKKAATNKSRAMRERQAPSGIGPASRLTRVEKARRTRALGTRLKNACRSKRPTKRRASVQSEDDVEDAEIAEEDVETAGLSTIKTMGWDEVHAKAAEFTSWRGYLETGVNFAFVEKRCLKEHSFSGSMDETYHLMRYFPVMYGNRFSEDCEEYRYFLTVRKLLLICKKQQFSKGDIVSLQECVRDNTHMRNVVRRLMISRHAEFGGQHPPRLPGNVTAKHHYVEHVVQTVLKYGPPSDYDTTRFEAMHGRMKKIIHSANNFKNSTKTMAQEYQLRSAVELSDTYFLQHDYSYKATNEDINEHPDFVSNRDEIRSIAGGYPLRPVKKLHVGDVEYRVDSDDKDLGTCVILKSVDEQVLLGKIILLLPLPRSNAIFVVDQYKALYHEHSGCYVLSDRPTSRVVQLTELPEALPLNIHWIEVEGHFLAGVVPRFLLH